MSRPEHELDVSRLPTFAFGPRDLVWWGTMGFVAIEGFTLFLCAISTIYLRRNFSSWPPLMTPRPDLLIPTINLGLILLLMVPMAIVDRAARALDAFTVRRWLVVACLLSAVITVLRGYEFAALHTRWDSNAYGSALWVTLGFHTTLIVADLFETAVLAAIFYRVKVEPKHFVDATNNSLYTYFMCLVWVPLYVLIFLWPGL